jgi:hypothetical protein
VTAAAVGVPAALALLALVDAAFAGFRAATGRNARIHKNTYNLNAARRGLAVGAGGASATALLVGITLVAATHPGHRYDELIHAGTRMLQVLSPFAAVVVLSLVAYTLLPMRQSTFVMLIGLGPFTLIRPAVVLGAATFAVAGSTDWLVWAATALATAGVLAAEPLVHHRWYREPQ